MCPIANRPSKEGTLNNMGDVLLAVGRERTGNREGTVSYKFFSINRRIY